MCDAIRIVLVYTEHEQKRFNYKKSVDNFSNSTDQLANWFEKLLRISEMGSHVNAIEEQITYICYFQSKCVVSPAKLSASIIALPSNSI